MAWINEFHYDNNSGDVGEFVEIAGAAGTDLTGWTVVLYNGSNGTSYNTRTLSGTISEQANGFGTFLVAYPDTSQGTVQNGSPDGIALVNAAGEVVQFISYEGALTASSGPAAGMTSVNIGVTEAGSEPVGQSLQLKGTGSFYEDFAWSAPSDDTPGAVNAGQTFEGGNTGPDTTAPSLVSSNPADDATGVNANGNIVLTFNETVISGTSEIKVTDGAGDERIITLGTDDGDGTVTFSGNTATIDLAAPLAQETAYDVVVDAGAIEDASGNPFAGIAADDLDFTTAAPAKVTLISEVQGSGTASTKVGETVTLEAIVVGDFQNGDGDDKRNLNGFYLQEETDDQDADAATSEGIFVYAPTGLDVAVGDKVTVTGSVSEHFGLTEITASDIAVVQAGAVADVDTLATEITLPAEVRTNADNTFEPDLEAYEGMLVRVSDTLTVTEQFNLDRFNEIKVVAGERPNQFTVDNAPDQAGYQAHLSELASRTITYDDGLSVQNAAIDNLDGFAPYSTETAPRMGDTVDGLTGVLDYNFDLWRIRAVEDGANAFVSTSERPEAPGDVGGTLKVASFNVLNYFTTLSGSTLSGLDPRGADSQTELDRQTDKLVHALLGLDADVLGLVELENNFSDMSGNAIAYLVDQLNVAAGGQVYDWVDPGQDLVGSDAIAVGFIYKTGTVEIAEGTAASILNDEDVDPVLVAQSSIGAVFDGANTSRNALAVTFEEKASGEAFTAAVNHFKSKSGQGIGLDADQGDGAGGWNNQRDLAAQALDQWLETNPTGSDDADKLILGDLNAYAMEEPIQTLENAGYENLESRLTDPYSYVFDGQKGSLDYILANESLSSQITGVSQWHINADEADALDYNTDFGRDSEIFDGSVPYRTSDHDPLVVGFTLGADQEPMPYTLQLLHFADAEASLLAPTTAPNLAALVDAFEDDYANTLILSGGDNYIASPFLIAGVDESLSALDAIGKTATARPDIAVLNEIGVEASAVGNHEFDFGPGVFDQAISPDEAWSGALFPHLTSNLDFTGSPLADNFIPTGETFPDGSALPAGAIAPAAVFDKGGEKIGVVGATTQVLERIASTGNVEVEGFPKAGEEGDGSTEIDDMQRLADQLQPIIDKMTADGIDKIILTSHLQDLDNERELATLLDGVDIILGAGSNTRLGDENDVAVEFPSHAAEFQGSYPIQVDDAVSGETTLIVNTDNEFTYLGRLAIQFDDEGNIIPESYDPVVNGAYASTAENVAAAWGDTDGDLNDTAFAEGTKGSEVKEITDAVQAVIDETNNMIIGYTDVALNGARDPGVRSEETNLGNITADASIVATRQALETEGQDATYVVALKNGGGIRAGIDAGEISQGEANAALAFNNRLMVFDATPEQLLNILDFAAGFPNGNGGFPQIGGLRYSYDEGAVSGERIQSVALLGEDGTVTALVENGAVVPGAPATIQVSVLNFTAQGGDGYPIKENGSNFRFLLNDGSLSAPVDESLDFTYSAIAPDRVVPENALGEQQAFADYLRANYGTPETAYDDLDTAEAGDMRIQNVDLREDTVLDGIDDGGTPGGGDDNDDDDGETPGTPPGGPAPTDDVTVTPNDEGGNDIDVGDPSGLDENAGTDGTDNVTYAGDGDIVLPGNIENVTLTGFGNAGVTGNGLANTIYGNAGANVIVASGGGDTVDGGFGDDTLAFDGPASQYIVTIEGGVAKIEDSATGDVQTVANVQTLSFSDGERALFEVDQSDIAGLYKAFLGRDFDEAGFAFWVEQSADGLDFGSFAQSFAASAEFQARLATETTDAIVADFYANVLGRAPDAAGLDYWAREIEGGADIALIGQSFVSSSEFQQNGDLLLNRDAWLNVA